MPASLGQWMSNLTLDFCYDLQTLANPFDWGVLLRGAPVVPPVMSEFADAATSAAGSLPAQQPLEAPQPRARRTRRRTTQVLQAYGIAAALYT